MASSAKTPVLRYSSAQLRRNPKEFEPQRRGEEFLTNDDTDGTDTEKRMTYAYFRNTNRH